MKRDPFDYFVAFLSGVLGTVIVAMCVIIYFQTQRVDALLRQSRVDAVETEQMIYQTGRQIEAYDIWKKQQALKGGE